MDACDQSNDCAPLAALLYDIGTVPNINELIAAAAGGNDFTVSHAPGESEGWAEVLRDGLTFDLRGLAGSNPQPAPAIDHALGINIDHHDSLAALQICPGPHISGAQRLLPVIRVAAALANCLAKIGQPRGICWIPARNAITPELFNRAVKPWLEGGPFPAIALASLNRTNEGVIRTTGLKFLIGQEFFLECDAGKSPEFLGRVAIRLIDWLVAHGPISGPTQAVLAGTGAVFLEVRDTTSIIARCA